MLDMVKILATPPAVIKLSRKLRTYFDDKRPKMPWRNLSLDALMSKVDIGLTAEVMQVHHDAQVRSRNHHF